NPISHTFTEPGNYDVSMTVTTIEGCVFDTTFTQYIEVFEYPTAMFTYSPIPATIYDTEINFHDFSSPDVTIWNWQLGNLANPTSSSEQNPDAIYPEGNPGEYP